MESWMLLAQTDLTGASGWTSFGIAGMVLAWLLLVHLPAKDKQIKELIDKHDETEKDQRTAYLAETKEMRGASERSIAVLTDNCKQEMQHLVEMLGKKLGVPS